MDEQSTDKLQELPKFEPQAPIAPSAKIQEKILEQAQQAAQATPPQQMQPQQQQQIGLGQIMQQPQFEKKPDSLVYSTITRKVAAAEVVNHLKKAKIYSIASIIGIFAALLAYIFAGVTVGTVVAAGFIIPIALYLRKVQTELQRLQIEYGI